MGWLDTGDAYCDACGKVRGCPIADKEQYLRAAGWHHAKGATVGGQAYEAILCQRCAKDERKRVRLSQEFEGQMDLFGGEYDRTEQPASKTARSRKFTGD